MNRNPVAAQGLAQISFGAVAFAPIASHVYPMAAALLLLYPDSAKRLGGLPPEFGRGFSALMGEERELRAAVRGAIAHVQGRQALNLIRILRHHDRQIGTIIGLIERRQDQLPQEVRFQAFTPSIASRVPGRTSADDVHAGTISRLIDCHLLLLHAIQALIKEERAGSRGDPLLDDAARRHDEMAWMLTALRSEDDGELPPSELAPAGATYPEGGWENEGGARPPNVGSEIDRRQNAPWPSFIPHAMD